ncbi:helix-turn-helix domain-containing protein [Wohlfahrtiimonas chitiniclastica]|uniref:helix-turn-helix domain-containing protein n=1 Tax=Wohlfahrtiimonas chitiniclastica TaxID=400946 RepID=UPI001BCBE639|nr:helix-turn-helix domain-containing protein [Wohlfahrtiimonas chitiniclastica]MBS7819648.1 helix-turn-helix domain-containing protein [Wohlfahrtiimonas chitiniclastica]
MAKVSVAEAAKLVGKSVKTIYRHIDTGKLSSSQNNNGTKYIDISELHRVYGDFKLKNENVVDSQMTEVENQNNNQLRLLLEQENNMLKKLLDEKENHIASLKQAMLLLEHKEQKASKNWITRLFGK